jgi:hypothetical protein
MTEVYIKKSQNQYDQEKINILNLLKAQKD